MTQYMYVNVSSSDISREMRNDPSFFYLVISELAYDLEGNYESYARKLFHNIFENEDDDVLHFLEAILVEFNHLKEAEQDEKH